MSPESIGSIRKKSQESLIEFLRADSALGFTFLQTAAIDVKDNPVDCRAAVERARTALAAIRYFAPRVEMVAVRQEIESGADRLEAEIRKF